MAEEIKKYMDKKFFGGWHVVAAETSDSTSLTRKAVFYGQPRDPFSLSSSGAPTDIPDFVTSS